MSGCLSSFLIICFCFAPSVILIFKSSLSVIKSFYLLSYPAVDPLVFTIGQAVGHGPRRSLAAALAQSPLSSSLAAFAEGLERAGTPSTNSVQIFQLFKLAGLHIALGTPQELVASRVFIRHLLVHQVPLLHPHLGEQLPGLPIDEVFLPRHTLILLSAPQISFSGAWPSSTAIRHRITTRRPALGIPLPIAQHHTEGEAQGGDQLKQAEVWWLKILPEATMLPSL